MVTEIRIYVEGGGDKESKAELRRGFSNLLGSLRDEARRRRIGWTVVLSGSRSDAFINFRLALAQHPNALNLLLVDSEGPVSRAPREHLVASDGDAGYLASVPDARCHLMVQAMEAWIIADPEALAAFYGQGFAATAIPGTRNVEQIAKTTVLSSLIRATRNAQKGEYHKTRHAPLILERLDPGKVRHRAPHCERLFAVIEQQLSATAP